MSLTGALNQRGEPPRRSRSTLYLANVVLLSTHEVDGAFWHEWELVGQPGGIQVFLIINAALSAVVLYGFRQVVRDQRYARHWALLLAGLGVFAVALHSIFLLLGRPQFRLPVSLALLFLIAVVSVLQLAHEARGALRAPSD